MFIQTIERRFGTFNVYLNDELIDTVFWSPSTVDEVKRSLIEHDNYDSEIEVYGEPATLVPLTRKEMRTLLDDEEVEVYKDVVKWRWRDAVGASMNTFDTEEEAMRDAIDAKELDTHGVEDTKE